MPPLKPRPSKLAKALQRVAAGTTVEPSHAPAIKAGFNTIATEVQNMHLAISSQTFNALAQVPGVSLPAAWVRSAHDAITHGVYSAVRHGGTAALSAAGVAERLMVDADAPPSKAQQLGRSALNGVFGDALAQAGNALAVRMSLHQHGNELTLTPESLAELRPRVAVFIHGLACDETSWLAQGGAQGGKRDSDYGSSLERNLGISAIYLRYNTGLAVDDNAQALSDLLEQLVQAAPARLRELTLIGHSMGGLVARRACAIATSSSATWQRRIGSIICLGTPHQGSGWEKLGHFAAAALNVSTVTQPLARLANARSQGIQDLRRGLKTKVAFELTREPPLRLLTGSLTDDTSSLMGKIAGSVLGDGLVAQYSAADDGLTGDVQRLHLAGVGHMALLHDARVEVALRSWLAVED